MVVESSVQFAGVFCSSEAITTPNVDIRKTFGLLSVLIIRRYIRYSIFVLISVAIRPANIHSSYLFEAITTRM